MLFTVLFSAASIRAQSIATSVTNIPTSATRLIAVVDGASLTNTLRNRLDVVSGAGSVTMTVVVPSGGPYRVRVIAYTAGYVFPAVLRSGQTSGVTVGGNSTVTASVALADVTGALDSSTPASGTAGTPATFKANITDPGDFLTGISLGEIWYSTAPFLTNLNASIGIGTLSSTGSGSYHFSVTMNLPTSSGTLYYQFAASSPAFNDPSGNETPFVVWPNLGTNASLDQITIAIGASLSVQITNIPTAATALVAVVDGGSLSSPLRSRLGVLSGAGSATMLIGVPSGGPYRVRAIAFTAGSDFPAVLASGKATGVSVGPGGNTNATATLAAVSGTLDPATPSVGAAGNATTLKADLTDPGDFLSGVTAGQLWYSTASFTANLDASIAFGTNTSTGAAAYQISGTFYLPSTTGTLYYQFAASSPSFKDPSGNETPFVAWPNLETGAALEQMSIISNSTGISIILNSAGCYTAMVQGVTNHATIWAINPQIGTLEVIPMWIGISPSSVSPSADQIDVACYIPATSGTIPTTVLLTATSVANQGLTASLSIDGHTGQLYRNSLSEPHRR